MLQHKITVLNIQGAGFPELSLCALDCFNFLLLDYVSYLSYLFLISKNNLYN
jgi:hypothetical protein